MKTLAFMEYKKNSRVIHTAVSKIWTKILKQIIVFTKD